MEWESYRKGTGYTAIGVSKDSKMGEDIMFVCSQVNKQYNLKIIFIKQKKLSYKRQTQKRRTLQRSDSTNVGLTNVGLTNVGHTNVGLVQTSDGTNVGLVPTSDKYKRRTSTNVGRVQL